MNTRGFTLLEVLVSLVIVAVALLALLTAAGHYARQSYELRERTLAQWIALDRLAEYQVDRALPGPGVERGETVQLGERWVWSVVIVEAPGEPDLRRLDIGVARPDRPDAPVATLTGFIGQR